MYSQEESIRSIPYTLIAVAWKHYNDDNDYYYYDLLRSCPLKRCSSFLNVDLKNWNLQGGPAKVKPTYIFDGNI